MDACDNEAHSIRKQSACLIGMVLGNIPPFLFNMSGLRSMLYIRCMVLRDLRPRSFKYETYRFDSGFSMVHCDGDQAPIQAPNPEEGLKAAPSKLSRFNPKEMWRVCTIKGISLQ